jgi:hypothetical protein
VAARTVPSAIHASRVGGVVRIGFARAMRTCAVALQLGVGGEGDGHLVSVIPNWNDRLFELDSV